MKFQFSAGGIVLRQAQDKFTKKGWEVLVCQHSQHHGWVFPKGLIGDKESRIKNQELRMIKETKEETAVREVKEETGVDAKIIKTLTPITYWFVFDKEKVRKTVYYFLMEYVGGDIAKHDEEMENVEWLPMDEVEERLTYKSDKEVWKQTREKIPNLKRQISNKSQ